MKRLKMLHKNSKKNSLYGRKAKREMKFCIFGGVLLFAVCFIAIATSVCAESLNALVSTGIILATAPVAGIVIPENKAKLIDSVRSFMEVSSDQERFINAIDKVLQEREKSNVEAYSTNLRESLKEVLGDIPKDESGKVETIASQIRSFAETIEKMETRLKESISNDFKMNLRKSVIENHSKIAEAIRERKYIQLDINTRAAVLMTTENTVTAPSGGYPFGTDFRGYHEIRYPKNFIIDIIGGRQVSQVPTSVTERNQNTDEGVVEVVPEGGLKPLVSFSYKDVVYRPRKIAAHIEYTDELKNSPERLYARILSLFENKVIRAWQDLTLDWVIATAAPYVSSALDGTQVIPTTPSALTAMALQIASLNFNPDIAYMNPADVEVAKWQQNNDGVYLIPPTDGLGTSLRVYASNSIEAGNALVGDSSTIKEEHSSFILKIGLINDQLIHNEETAVGEIFQLLYQNEFFEGSWVYADLETVKTAIKK